MNLNFLLLIIFGSTVDFVYSSKIETKIYQQITNYHPCVLLTNATHQVGCTSEMKGNRGIVHLVNEQKELIWLVKEGTHNPYIVLLNYSMFNEPVMLEVMASKKVSGVLVMHNNESGAPTNGFSPDEKCPMDRFGIYSEHPQYGKCQKVEWNKIGNGMSMVYYGIPIFLLTDKGEINDLIKCYMDNNHPKVGVVQSYPLCAVEMKDFMFAAKDTPTCQRKTEMANPIQSTYCDPLGDNNVIGTLFPVVGELQKDEVVVVSARLDSTAFFHDFSPAADNGVTGIVALLAAAKALGNYKRKLKEQNKTEDLKPILFALYNGEVWDYIGSSRVVWDMKRESFPYSEKNRQKNALRNDSIDDSTYMSKINLTNIGYYLELSQLGLGDSVYAHSDPLSQKDNQVKEKVSTIIEALNNASQLTGAKKVEVVDRDTNKQPLPPASFQRFLRERPTIPGVVLTDHKQAFSNRFYNSRYDNPENLGLRPNITKNNTHGDFVLIGSSIGFLTNTSLVIANALYLLASGGKPPAEEIKVDKSFVAHLLYCLLWTAKCPAFKEVLGHKSQGLPNVPLSRYVSVKQLDNPITLIIHRLLAYYTGEILPESECSGKTSASLPAALSYVVVRGRNHSYVCVRHSTYLTTALSPAFELKDYDSTEYSTWMESMWSSEMGIRMYLVENPTFEVVILITGLLMSILPFFIVLFCTKKAFILFTPNIMIMEG